MILLDIVMITDELSIPAKSQHLSDLPAFFGPMISRKMAPMIRLDSSSHPKR